MDDRQRELADRLAALMERMALEMGGRQREVWTETELTMPQFRTLNYLRSGPLRMNEIAANVGSSLSSASSMIDRLVDKGLVERGADDSDRRVVTCELTPTGTEEVERMWRFGRSQMHEIADLLSEAELAGVVSAMETLMAAVKRRSGAEGTT